MPASSSCCGSDPDSGSGYCCTLVKTGMLLNQEIITAVAEQVEALGIYNGSRSSNGIT